MPIPRTCICFILHLQIRSCQLSRQLIFNSSHTISSLTTFNSNIQIFNSNLHPEFGNLRTLTIDGEPWFVGKDVAEALGYKNTADAIGKHVDADDKLTSQIAMAGQKRAVTIINESGLYSLILSSKLESAKTFKHWVTAEVLPTIRKTGGIFVKNPFLKRQFVYSEHQKSRYSWLEM